MKREEEDEKLEKMLSTSLALVSAAFGTEAARAYVENELLEREFFLTSNTTTTPWGFIPPLESPKRLLLLKAGSSLKTTPLLVLEETMTQEEGWSTVVTSPPKQNVLDRAPPHPKSQGSYKPRSQRRASTSSQKP